MKSEINKEIDKMIRKEIYPCLKEHGFTEFKGRTALCRKDDCIGVFQIRGVGAFHSMVTHWHSCSLTTNLGIHYNYLEEFGNVKRDEQGLLYPREYECHRRGYLMCSYDQLKYTNLVNCNAAEKKRKDIWWVEPDGSNLIEVIDDIKDNFLKFGVKWFHMKSDKELTLKNASRLKGGEFENVSDQFDKNWLNAFDD